MSMADDYDYEPPYERDDSGPYYWGGKLIRKMETSHILNCIKIIEKKDSNFLEKRLIVMKTEILWRERKK